VHLKSLSLRGFKSFPDRTRLDFGPGVSVVVGPNGSGKSNITDAVLWVMGEQSPLAVRGQSMQDVIFGGGRGVQARSSAEVEIVLDNSDGAVDLPLSEISIVRRLERAGEGGYQLNGARCRLTDVIEMLSDTGLGKETHSIISQGRVEAIVTSKPRDRRLLIEEAAGLGKHRKRRRRAQLKLERTQENLDRALDVEREARGRLRPLKRQAEAAQLHERLERQTLQARWELGRESLRALRGELASAEARVGAARGQRAEVESRLQAVIDRRGRAERALTDRAEHRDVLARRLYGARSARERVGLREEQVRSSALALARRIERLEMKLDGLEEGERGLAEVHSASAARAAAGAGREDRAAASPQSPDGGAGDPSAARGERALGGSLWSRAWDRVRNAIVDGVEHVLSQPDERARSIAAAEVAAEAERLARVAIEQALARAAGPVVGERERRETHPGGEADGRARWIERSRAQHALDVDASSLAKRLGAALQRATRELDARVEQFGQELARDTNAGEDLAGELRACAGEETEVQARLRALADRVTEAEVLAQRLRDQVGEAQLELQQIAERLGFTEAEAAAHLDTGKRDRSSTAGEAAAHLDAGERDRSSTAGEAAGSGAVLDEEQRRALLARIERLARRREQLGPVNPLAQEQYAEAVAHVEEMEGRRADMETALRELRTVIRDTDRQIQQTFRETFEAASLNFSELAGELFPGGSGQLRLVREAPVLRPVLGGLAVGDDEEGEAGRSAIGPSAADGEPEEPEELEPGVAVEPEAADAEDEAGAQGVEIEITPAGKWTKRLSLLSGGEKSMVALAFLFAVFLARPCPFYVLDEVEAALDDLNLERFLALLRRYSERTQFIVITHQKRTMEAAHWLYGVSMGDDGVSKVLSRRLPAGRAQTASVAEVA
jgi:chromosome segregation protein